MSFDLEEYTPETMAEGDKLKPSDIVGHPLIVKVLDYKTGITTKYSPGGDGEAVVVDVFDMAENKIHLGVMWFNSAIRDNLRNKVGKAMPVRIIFQDPKKPGGNPYLVPEGLEGEDLETAKSWAKAKPTMFEDERNERGMGPYGSDTPDPQPQGGQFDSAPTSAAKPPAATKPPAANKPPQPATKPVTSAAAPAPAEDDEEIPF